MRAARVPKEGGRSEADLLPLIGTGAPGTFVRGGTVFSGARAALAGPLAAQAEDAVHGERAGPTEDQAEAQDDEDEVVLEAALLDVEAVRPVDGGDGPGHDDEDAGGGQAGQEAAGQGDAADQLPPGHGQ